MNFLGHAHVALWRQASPARVLGSMLPDFATMAGVRLGSLGDEELALGVRLHHQTDDVFHALPAFFQLMQYALDALTERGVARGPARAVGHIGVELLIDGELVRDPQLGQAYLSALEYLRTVPPEALGVSQPGRLASLRERLSHFGIPYDYARPEVVGARLAKILEQRPRLALSADAQGAVGSILPDLQAHVQKRLPDILDGLARGLSIPAIREP